MTDCSPVNFTADETGNAQCLTEHFLQGCAARHAAGRCLENGNFSNPHDPASMEGRAFAAGWSHECHVFAGAEFPSNCVGAYAAHPDAIDIYFGLAPEPPTSTYRFDNEGNRNIPRLEI